MTPGEMIEAYGSRISIVFEINDPRTTGPLLDLIAGHMCIAPPQVTSFFWFPLLEARAIDPALTLGYLTPSFSPDMVERTARRGFQQICPHVDSLTGRRFATAHECGLTVRTWGVDQRVQVERIVETGTDGATVNWPDWLPSVMGEQAARSG